MNAAEQFMNSEPTLKLPQTSMPSVPFIVGLHVVLWGEDEATQTDDETVAALHWPMLWRNRARG